MRWRFLTEDAWPLTNGTALRVWHLARTLARAGDRVTLVTNYQPAEQLAPYRDAGIELVTFAPARQRPQGALDPFPHDPAWAEPVARAHAADHLVFAGANMLQYLHRAPAGAILIADIIDDPCLALRRRFWFGSPRWWLRRARQLVEFRRYEKHHVLHAQLCTFVTDADSDAFQRRHRRARVLTVPNGVDLEHFQLGPATVTDPPEVVFVGNYGFVPNQTAAAFLIRRVAPLVWRKRPETRFVLVGPNPTAEMTAAANDRLVVTGLVDDVRDYLARAAVVIIPMVTGTGIKNKLLEAWAAARPVVATPLACQGLPARPGENVLVGAHEGELAGAVGRLLDDGDLRQRLAQSGRASVQQDLSWPAVARRLRAALEAQP